MPGLGASFGRGAATTYQQDLANSDCILIMGSNMAEAHPVGFRWPMKAKEKGATLIHVDPRFTRTSALCDVFVDIRAGSDIAFLGGLVNYVLSNDRWFQEYVLSYTNASTIIQEGFQDTEDLAGLFSGYNGDGRDRQVRRRGGTLGLRGLAESGEQPAATVRRSTEPGSGLTASGAAAHSAPRQDMTAHRTAGRRATRPCSTRAASSRSSSATSPGTRRRSSPRCAAAPPEELVRVAELLCANSGRERTSAIVYALGWTQHTTGVQMIRTAGILQLLLGNIGRPGGGIMAMRGHSSIQGSTDLATLYDVLPGYLPQPAADEQHETLDSYVEHEGLPTGYWANFRKFIVSLLKAWYGDAATPENDFGFAWLPRVDADYSQLPYFDRMARGEVKGYFLFGQNPGGGGPNAGLHRPACATSTGWWCSTGSRPRAPSSGRATRAAPPPADIKTEVFFIPAAAAPEKEGSLTNTQRMLQWHDKAIDPLGDCRSDAWFVYNLGKRLRQLYAGSTDPRDQPLLSLTWDYDFDEPPRLPDGTRQPDRGRTGPREGAPGDQRPSTRRDRPAHRPAAPGDAASPS